MTIYKVETGIPIRKSRNSYGDAVDEFIEAFDKLEYGQNLFIACETKRKSDVYNLRAKFYGRLKLRKISNFKIRSFFDSKAGIRIWKTKPE